MEVIDWGFEGVKLLKPKVFKDKRGFFLETYQKLLYEKLGVFPSFVQDNHSFSQKGSLRGMHFQSAPGQAKLIRVAVGEIYDVIVDIRPESPTYCQWEGMILNGDEHHQLFIPIGFAHGFCVISAEAHVLYKVSSPYDPLTEKGFRWNDPFINIQWPEQSPVLSERDQNSPFFEEIQK